MILLYHIYGLLGRDCGVSFAESGITIAADTPDVSAPEKQDIPQVCEAVVSALSDMSGICTYSYERLSGVHQLSYGNLFRICIPENKLGRYVV